MKHGDGRRAFTLLRGHGLQGGEKIPGSASPSHFSRPPAAPLRRVPAPSGLCATARFELIRTVDGIAALETEWDELYSNSGPRNPFLSHAWTLACLALHDGRSDPFVLVLRVGGRLAAIAPLCIDKSWGVRIVRFIADDRSDYLGFLCKIDMPGLEQALFGQLMALAGEWDLALLRQLADAFTSLASAPSLAPLRFHRTMWIRAPYCAWQGDWESLHKAGPSWFREMRKRKRRFFRDGYRAQRLTGLEAAGALSFVSEIEAHSWKGRQGTARFQPGSGRELLHRAFETLGSSGEMELWLAFIGERPVAFQVDFVLPDRLWHYQCAYREDARQTRAGSVLAYLALERLWSCGIREFDYLSGEEPYKLERTNASREIHHLAVHSPTAKGWLAFCFLVAPRWRLRDVPSLRRMYRAGRPLKRLFGGLVRRLTPRGRPR